MVTRTSPSRASSRARRRTSSVVSQSVVGHPGGAERGGERSEVQPVLGCQPLVVEGGCEEHPVGPGEGPPIGLEEEGAAGRQAPWLEEHHDAAPGIALAQRAEGLVHRGRMVREVVHHGHAPAGPQLFQPPLDAMETAERRGDVGRGQAVAPCRGPDRQRVRDVVLAGERQRHLDLAGLRVEHPEAARLGQRLDRAGRPDFIPLVEPVEDHPAARPRRQLADLRRIAAGDQQPAGGHDVDQASERREQCLRRGVEVGVVVLGAGEDQRVRPVVQELGAAVEIGRVVLVPLDDETLAGAVAEAGRQVLRRAADQIAGIRAAGRVYPGGHGRGRRLAMRPRHHQRPVVLQEEARQRLRHRDPLETEPFSLDRLGVVAMDGVADHHQVGPGLEVGRVVPDGRIDPSRLEKGGHGWVQGAVRATDTMALRLQKTGKRSHPRTADREAIDVELPEFHAGSSRLKGPSVAFP